MRIIRNAEEGRRLLLSREPLDTEQLPMDMRETMFAPSGRSSRPDEVVRRIIRDVREDGDNAMRFYNSRLDGAPATEAPRDRARKRAPPTTPSTARSWMR